VRRNAKDSAEDAPAVTLERFDRTLALGVFVLVLLVYVFTLYPSVAGGDSGELIGAVGSGGVIHPPGYPAYAVLGQLFARLPFGDLAWRLNLMSAVCDAAAAALLLLATTLFTRSRGAGLLAAALFAFSPGVWRYAITAEVFALNNLVVAALLLVALLYAERRERRVAMVGAFLFGLGMSNHHTVLFTAVPLAAWVLWRGRKDLLRSGPLVGLGTAFALGLLPYLYLPIATRHHAVVSWGAADTWQGFLTHLLRREYGTFQLAPTGIAGAGASSGETLGAWLSDLLEQVGVTGGALAVLGILASLRGMARDPRGTTHAAVVLLIPVVLSVGVFATLGNLPVSDALHRGIVARFWQQPELYICFWCGAGLAALGSLVGARFEPPAACVVALLAVGLRFTSMDRSKSVLVREYGAEILRAAPPGALIFTKGDLITSTVRYLQLAEKLRPDVRIVDQELLGLPWMKEQVLRDYPDVVIPGARYMPGTSDGFTMKELLDKNVGHATVLICGGIKAGDTSADASYGLWPWGLCDRVNRGSDPVNLETWIKDSDAALPRIDFAGQPHPKGSWEDIVWGDYWEVRQERAAQLLRVAGRDPAKHKYIVEAGEILQAIVRENPNVPPHIYKNLATALGRAGLDTPEQKALAADAWQHYLDASPKSDPQRPAIEQELLRLRTKSP
jgi:Protein of unknown function (DUF2723)